MQQMDNFLLRLPNIALEMGTFQEGSPLTKAGLFHFPLRNWGAEGQGGRGAGENEGFS